MSLKVKEYHDCEKPDMVLSVEQKTRESGFWWWRKTHSWEHRTYETREAFWECSSCKSTWRYHGRGIDTYEGYWNAEKRTYTWKKV